jgi:anti-sigma28 factor (negative regulator of flagellin synthesis)
MELDRIKKLVYMLADIRECMVAEFKAQILGGVYEVSPEQVVEGIIWHGIYMLSVPGINDN